MQRQSGRTWVARAGYRLAPHICTCICSRFVIMHGWTDCPRWTLMLCLRTVPHCCENEHSVVTRKLCAMCCVVAVHRLEPDKTVSPSLANKIQVSRWPVCLCSSCLPKMQLQSLLTKQDACCLFLAAVATLLRTLLRTVTLCHVWPCLLSDVAAELPPS